MALFNWFSRKFDAAGARREAVSASHGRPPPLNAQKPEPDAANPSEVRKARRHTRREQLFVAVREAMTRSGVLAASYKFKVLSLDHLGDQFLVMVDVDGTLGHQAEKLLRIEAAIVQTAKARFEMLVTSVYWRTDAKVGPRIVPLPAGAVALTAKAGPVIGLPGTRALPRYEPLQDDEVAAFKQALAAASGSSRTSIDANGKSRSGPHSYTLLTGFEDTEMPESPAAPALSATQYGDLN